MQAYIYARFSTLEQAKGSSLARQLKDCRAFCEARGWEWSAEREIVDEGRSAFDGTNRTQGSGLAEFELKARMGQLPTETALVVERLDRLSRQSATDVFTLITSLTDAGVTIATVDGARLYTRGSFEFGSLIELIVKAHVAFEESEKKSQRVAAAWEQKRAKAKAGDREAVTRRCPAWIAVDEKTRKYVLIEDRAAIIRRIFHLTVSGHGKHMIASTLNREGVPTWGRGKTGWHPSYIQKIISSRAVIGEYQPHTKTQGKRLVAGEPVRGMYPVAVDEATFARAQVERSARATAPGRKTRAFSNLFTGLVRCGECGRSMTFRNKGKPGEQYLVCDGALRHLGCSNRAHFQYNALEAAVIDQTLHLALDDRHFAAPAEAAALDAERARQVNLVEELKNRQRRLVDLFSRNEMPEVERQLRQVTADAAAAEGVLDRINSDLLAARGKVSPRENVERIRKMLSALISNDEEERATARGTVQQALRGVIDEIVCDPVEMVSLVRAGSSCFQVERNGTLRNPDGPPEIGLQRLLGLRERGWVLARHVEHPALGKS